MTRLEIQAPGLDADERVEVPQEGALLLVRRPDPGAVDAAAAPVAIASRSVSQNHVIAWRSGEAVCLRDLRSRNGTWLRLPPDEVVRVERPRQPLRLQLAAAPAAAGAAAGEPDDASWSARADFADGVARAVIRWSRERGVRLRVGVLPAPPAASAGGYGGHLRLADGRVLEVEPANTLDDVGHAVFATLWRWLTRQNALFEAEEESRAEGLILASDAIREAHRQVYAAATRGARALLLLGPSGAGKEGLARCFHRATGRDGPFVARNCALFSRELMRSELFGAEAGAFTGATRRIVGAVERAHGGTLFLDELAELDADVQPVLLRFLDTGEYERLGRYGQPETADVRVVGATNADLRAEARAGRFRADLWYRLSVQVVHVPPLRERPEDVEAYLRLERLASGASAWEALDPDARELVLTHPWDGNFRELMNFVAQLPLAATRIDAARCRQALARVSLSAPAAADSGEPVPPVLEDAWAQLAVRSLRAFGEDLGKPSPETWDEVKLYLEKFLKPLLFAHLGGVAGDEDAQRGLIATLSRRLQTDRNTCAKQLARFSERFSGG